MKTEELTPVIDQLVQEQLATGKYRSRGEVLVQALRQLTEHDQFLDDLEAAALYDLIEKSVASRFYERDSSDLPIRWITMLTHTLSTLGPKVLASRMVSDYVERLYAPAAISARDVAADDYALARDLAGYRSRVLAGWHGVRVEHVEATGVGDAPQRGQRLIIRAFVALGDLGRDDVRVELVSGRVDHNDRIVNRRIVELAPIEKYEGNRWRYETEIDLLDTGAFGERAPFPRLPAGSRAASFRKADRLPRHQGAYRIDRRILRPPARLALVWPQRGERP